MHNTLKKTLFFLSMTLFSLSAEESLTTDLSNEENSINSINDESSNILEVEETTTDISTTENNTIIDTTSQEIEKSETLPENTSTKEIESSFLPESPTKENVNNSKSAKSSKQHFDLGVGLGLDYGGIVGAKIGVMPFPYMSLFGSTGFYLFTVGWSVGLNVFILPATTKNSVRPYLQIMYGTNCGIYVSNYDEYSKVFNGFTPGVGLAVRFGDSKRHGFDFNMNFPIRSDDYKKHMDMIYLNSYVSTKTKELPFAISVGYHFSL